MKMDAENLMFLMVSVVLRFAAVNWFCFLLSSVTFISTEIAKCHHTLGKIFDLNFDLFD